MTNPFDQIWPFAKQYGIEKEILALQKEIEAIDGIRELTQHRGWIELKKLYLERVAKNDGIIVSLAENPVKNENELRSRQALRKAMLGLIGCVDVLLGSSADIQKKLKTLMGTTQMDAPQFMPVDKRF
jgi:hypothetical protein